MVEAKMNPKRGKGTPHPKGRRSLMQAAQEEDRQSDHILNNVLQDSSNSSLQNLVHVHTQVTQTLHQIDKMVLNIHKLASSNQLVPDEVQDFADAFASIDANLQDWNDFLKTVAERPPRGNLEQEPCNSASTQSTPLVGAKCTGLEPLSSGLEPGIISGSPLVTPDLLDSDSLCSSETFVGTTSPDRAGGSTSLSPFPQTPRMLSPPRSIRVLSAISENPSSSTPNPLDLLTPEGLTCQSHLVFETPAAQVIHCEQLLSDGRLFIPETPGFGVSPPRTCRPLQPGEMVLTESDPVPSTPIRPSPFRTPGILLEYEGELSESGSGSSTATIDDLTASTVKRLGPRGLEERLWQELAIRNADILQSVKYRQADRWAVQCNNHAQRHQFLNLEQQSLAPMLFLAILANFALVTSLNAPIMVTSFI